MSWQTVAIAATVGMVSSVTALVVVAAIHRAAVLSTVALSLAIVAFSSQLIIAIGQGHADAEQIRRTEDISTRTSTTLTEIKTATEGVLKTLQDEFHTVLSAVLAKTFEGDSDNAAQERLVPILAEPSDVSASQVDEETDQEDGRR